MTLHAHNPEPLQTHAAIRCLGVLDGKSLRNNELRHDNPFYLSTERTSLFDGEDKPEQVRGDDFCCCEMMSEDIRHIDRFDIWQRFHGAFSLKEKSIRRESFRDVNAKDQMQDRATSRLMPVDGGL